VTPPRFKVLWTEIARRDLGKILAFIAVGSPPAAKRLLRSLQKKAASLETFPLRGRAVPELADLQLTQFRELLSPPYRLLYRVEERQVFVLAVLDGRRRLDDLLLERLVDS